MQPVESTNPPSSDRTILWIVGGVIALCLCAAVVVVVAAAGFIYLNAGSVSGSRIPIINEATPQDSGGDCDECAIVEDIPDLGTDHVDDGTRVNYNSNPPSSGPHYDQWIEPGFYDTTVPDGHIVHNLEHGYVVIWYNCETLSSSECTSLENDISELVDDLEYKVIGMNRTGNMDHVIALTSWGKLAYLDSFVEAYIRDFYADNLENSPEPDAP